MAFGFIRVLFILISAVVGFQLGSAYQGYASVWGLIGAWIGVGTAFVIVFLEHILGRVSLRGLSAAVFGLLMALIVSSLLNGAIDLVPHLEPGTAASIKVILVLVLSYLGIVFTMRGRDEFNLVIPYIKFERQDQRDTLYLLDTSVIIDGRILDVCETRFIEGRLVVPRFVLKELQQVADSKDPLKRNRGRRGLDVLGKLRKASLLNVRIHEEDFPELPAVDEKLVKLAKLLGARVLTNDYNLNKVAELQGVTILNVNELANALKTVLLPGETMEVKLVKEGKEPNQAVGYLDDGTMVVVDQARRLLGNSVSIVVTSVLQTSAGRMVFGKLQTS
ncbi:MAG: hypothetical protein HY593_04890 [Candidatus Omnitrophica bacterium]|nr:hypothetical protein [Candidatus Omnitrophota bacterium]